MTQSPSVDIAPAALKDVPAAALTGLPLALCLTNPRFADNPIVYANAAFARLTGHPIDAVIGRNCRFLQGPDTEPDRVAEVRAAVAEGRDVTVQLTNHRADGSAFLNRLSITALYEGDELHYFLGTQSIVGGELDAAGLESVHLQLTEIQHRVKNHLAMIVSLIRLQASGSAAVDDYGMLARRIEALQLLYQELSDSGVSSTTSNEVPLGAYVSRIAAAIGHLDGRSGVRINVIAEEVKVEVGVAARVGLLVNEVLTNAFQHAFEGRDGGLVETRLQRLNQGIRIQISDDGVGIAEGQDWPEAGNLGSKIVRSLLTGLDARHTVVSSHAGTTITIDLPDPSATT